MLNIMFDSLSRPRAVSTPNVNDNGARGVTPGITVSAIDQSNNPTYYLCIAIMVHKTFFCPNFLDPS